MGLKATGLVAPLDTIGVVLAGDLYSDPGASKRGATGDVRDVWRAFARSFRWVAGVAGNHDTFGASRDRERFGREPGIHLLDGEVVELDGLRIGGVSGIIGPPEKTNRRNEESMLVLLEQVVAASPEVILHEGPDCGRGRPGNAAIGQVLARCREPLIVCGHVHWPDAVAVSSSGAQVLNATERILLLLPRS
jgi:Icc-related predicted phosphoesterase